MKIVILSEIEQFCKDHNFRLIDIERLRQLAREDKPSGTEIEFAAGYGQCLNDLLEFVRERRP